MLQTKYNREKQPGEINSGEILVDKAGYVSKHKRIKAIMDAGERLIAARREMYDYIQNAPDDETEPDIDPTRSPNFDMADATQLTMEINERKRQKEKEIREAERAAKIAHKEAEKAAEALKSKE